MKKTTFIATLLLLLSAYSYSQKGLIETTTIKGRGNSIDTIIRKKTEINFGKTIPNNYKRNETVVQSLRPYLVSDIVNPTNRSHPLYLQRMKEAREKLPLAKADILQRMKVVSRLKEWMSKININNEADLNSVNFMFLPVYYLTPNVVYFKNGENIAKYYSLGRGGFKYLMLRNNKLIGYLNFYPNNSELKSDFLPIRLRDAESFNQIIKLGKTPIGLAQSVSNDPKTIGAGNGYMFGYVEQGHLVFSYYEESIVQKVSTDANIAPNRHFQKTYNLETAESFFSGSGNSSTINSWLDNAVNNLKNKSPR